MSSVECRFGGHFVVNIGDFVNCSDWAISQAEASHVAGGRIPRQIRKSENGQMSGNISRRSRTNFYWIPDRFTLKLNEFLCIYVVSVI